MFLTFLLPLAETESDDDDDDEEEEEYVASKKSKRSPRNKRAPQPKPWEEIDKKKITKVTKSVVEFLVSLVICEVRLWKRLKCLELT